MSGTLAVVAQPSSRYSMFWVCFLEVLSRAPQGTRWDVALSTNVAHARNTLVERSIEAGSEWICFLDDDQVFPNDTLTKLLAHDEPIVSALYMQRAGSHAPVAFSGWSEETLYKAIDLKQLPGEGLLRVHACGAGGLLVKTEVFREISNSPDWFEYGRVGQWEASEDIIFCEKANAAGIPIYVDLGTPIGHMAESATWPSYVDKEWCYGFSISDSTRVYVPIEEKAAAAADAVRR